MLEGIALLLLVVTAFVAYREWIYRAPRELEMSEARKRLRYNIGGNWTKDAYWKNRMDYYRKAVVSGWPLLSW